MLYIILYYNILFIPCLNQLKTQKISILNDNDALEHQRKKALNEQ